jgi:hypothetical protein
MSSLRGRLQVLNAIDDWLKLLALIVLVSESVFGVLLLRMDKGDPQRVLIAYFMAGIIGLIVVLSFIDKWRSSRTPIRPESTAAGEKRVLNLGTRWYFRSAITEEELRLTISGHGVAGTRRTSHPKKGAPKTYDVKTYDVSGWNFAHTLWLEYHDPAENGGGVLLLDEITNDTWTGVVCSKDCNTGVKQSRANMWFRLEDAKQRHQQDQFMFVGAVAMDGSRLVSQPEIAALEASFQGTRR